MTERPSVYWTSVHLPSLQASNCRRRCRISPFLAQFAPLWRLRVWGYRAVPEQCRIVRRHIALPEG